MSKPIASLYAELESLDLSILTDIQNRQHGDFKKSLSCRDRLIALISQNIAQLQTSSGVDEMLNKLQLAVKRHQQILAEMSGIRDDVKRSCHSLGNRLNANKNPYVETETRRRITL